MLAYNKILVDTDSCTVTYNGELVYLGRKEYLLLIIFLKYPNHVLSYDVMIDSIWDESNLPTESTIRSHIKNLKKAFKKVDADVEIIENLYGIGYRLKPAKQNGNRENTPIAPSVSLFQKWIKAKAIEYLVIDQSLIVKSMSPGVSIYSDYPEELKLDGPAGEAFPELIGCEEVFEKVLNQEQLYFEIKGIARACNPLRPDYINFYALADLKNRDELGRTLLFIFFEDDSEYMRYKQRLVQQENESYLLLQLQKN